jgi:hypothetical protein
MPRWLASRIPAAVGAAVVLVAGLGVRAVAGGEFAKYAGVALYAALVYALVVCAAPRMRHAVAVAVALGVSWAVEFAQLSPVPAALSARSTVARLALGSTFNPPDLAWYAVGVAVALGVHVVARRIGRRAGWQTRQP